MIILYSIGKFSKETGISISTLRRWDKEIIDNTERTEEQELVEDLIQIITVFSCRLQGKRAHKAKKILKELLSDDTNKES